MTILFVILILCIAVLGGVLVVFDSWNDRLWKENRALRKELERAKRADGEWQGTADGYADGELVFDEWACSECGYEIETDDPDELPTFCPCCGAKMKSEEG